MNIKFSEELQVYSCSGRSLNQSFINIYLDDRFIGEIRRKGKIYLIEITYNGVYDGLTAKATTAEAARGKATELINKCYSL